MSKGLIGSIVETTAWCALLLMAAGVATLLITEAELRVDPPRWAPNPELATNATQSPPARRGEAAVLESIPVALVAWRWAVAH